MINSIWQKIKNNYLFFIFLIIALTFRSYHWPSSVFGFDQVQILTNAEQIIAGKLTLIGPRTGPADTFTGPAIYYLTAISLLLVSPTQAVILLPLLLSAATGLIIYYLSKCYLGKKTASVATAIWAISPILLNLDRIFWNPNLSLMAFALVVIPLFSSKKVQKIDLYLIALGSFLAYQAHFSAFLLIPAVLLTILINKRPKIIFLASLSGLAISLLPTLLFDLRHNFLNIKGIWDFINHESGGFDTDIFLQNFYLNLRLTLDIFARLLYHGKNSSIRSWLGFLLLLICFFIGKKQNR